MKSIHLLITVIIALLSTGIVFSENDFGKQTAGTTTTPSKKEDHKVISLNQDVFIEKIFDYKNNKEWKYKGDRPAIIDFYAEWCGPCKKLAPILVELQQEYKEKIQIYKIDAEKNRELAAVFGVTAYPTIIFIPMNANPASAKGLLPKEELERIIREFLKVDK